jgi:hypothetical protein
MAADPGQEKKAIKATAAAKRQITALILSFLSRFFPIDPWAGGLLTIFTT